RWPRRAPASSSGPTACACCAGWGWPTPCSRWSASPKRCTCTMAGREGSWRHGAPYWTVHRRDLHDALLRTASAEPSITLHTGFSVIGAIQSADAVDVASAGGDRAAGAGLVGADGLWSRVRHLVGPARAPQFVGSTATRTVIPAAMAGRLAERGVGLWVGAGANIAHYPVRGGAEIAAVVIA